MKLNEFYGLLRDAVRYYPETDEFHERLQTFAVLQSVTDLNSDSLGHSVLSKDTPYFYSRRWESIEHNASHVVYHPPLVYSLPLSNLYQDPFKRRSYQKTRLEIGALYPAMEKSTGVCKRISREEIFTLASEWMDYLFYYLSGGVFAQTNEDPTGSWYNQDQLEQYIVDGVITSYSIHQARTNQFQSDLKRENPTLEGSFVDNYGGDNFCGVFYVLTVPALFCGDHSHRFSNDCC